MCEILRRTIEKAGKVYGKLTVIRRLERDEHPISKSTSFYFECLCECGNTAFIYGSNLHPNGTKSCGCGKKTSVGNRKWSREESTWRTLWKHHQGQGRDRGLITLDYQTWKNQLTEFPNCYHCGDPPRQRTYKHGDPIYCHGIDRIDSSKGYIIGNIQTSCRECNVSKQDMSDEEFHLLCNKVARQHPVKY